MSVKKSAVQEQPKINLKWMRDKDREMVRGIFHFHEVPGGTLKFSFRKYKEDPVEDFEMCDGQIYTIPLGVAKHLNKNVNYPVHAYEIDETGRHIMKVGQKVQRVSFQSLEFLDIEDVSSERQIVTVEHM